MKITKRGLRRIIREVLEFDSPPSYDPAKARGFNDAATYPSEIIRLLDDTRIKMNLPNPSHRKSQSGRADPPDYALAKTFAVVRSMAKELEEYFKGKPE